MSSRIFVDETKRAGYVIAAVTVSDTEAIRTIVRALVLPGQRRIHMKHEQARRRRVIVSALAAMQVQATVYDAARRYRTDLAARTACLTALVEDIAARDSDTRLVIEQDDSVVRADRHDLFQLVRQAGITDRLEYRHQRAYDELLLALPDIVAWSWVRSGEWRRRISPILTTVRTIRSPESAKPERRVRPDGSRAHFLAASAAGKASIGRDRGNGPSTRRSGRAQDRSHR